MADFKSTDIGSPYFSFLEGNITFLPSDLARSNCLIDSLIQDKATSKVCLVFSLAYL